MFILNEPYISKFCVDTLNENSFFVLNTDAASDRIKNLLNDEEFLEKYTKNKKLYTNSENSIDKITDLLKNTDAVRVLSVFKDKLKTRELLSKIYPDFFFKKVSLEELENFDVDAVKYPCVIKPAVGFLSFGVYTVWNKTDFKNTVKEVKKSLEKALGLFPKSVLSSDDFIIEEYIEGEEFAADVYFDETAKPVILNIYKHPFLDKNDVSDRIYISSKEIILKYLEPFNELFEKLGKCANLSNFPMHIELRVKDSKIVPIEINPYRFAGWCLCDLTYFAYGVNPYVYYENSLKPCWGDILKSKNDIYGFVVADIPQDIDKKRIMSFDVENFKKDLKAEILDERVYDFREKPVFATLFIKLHNEGEIENILNIKTRDYTRVI